MMARIQDAQSTDSTLGHEIPDVQSLSMILNGFAVLSHLDSKFVKTLEDLIVLQFEQMDTVSGSDSGRGSDARK